MVRQKGVRVVGNIAYVAASGALITIDITIPSKLQIMGKVDTPGYAYEVDVSGNYAYLATGWTGLSIVDISNLITLLIVGSFVTDGFVESLTVKNGIAYLASGFEGLRIIDISDPTNPCEVSVVPSVIPEEGCAIDVSQPSSPKKVSYIDPPCGNEPDESVDEWSEGVIISGHYAYLSDGECGIVVIDISDPFNPREVCRFRTGDYAIRARVKDNFIFLADGNDGLWIFRHDIKVHRKITFYGH
ncbi:MAG: LVIVD repeat-containing protein [Candidatus Aminicenantales bacterium]